MVYRYDYETMHILLEAMLYRTELYFHFPVTYKLIYHYGYGCVAKNGNYSTINKIYKFDENSHLCACMRNTRRSHEEFGLICHKNLFSR